MSCGFYKLKKIMKKNNTTEKELAKKLNKSVGELRKIEKSKKINVKAEDILKALEK